MCRIIGTCARSVIVRHARLDSALDEIGGVLARFESLVVDGSF
jgi:hypothetical protein